MMLCHSQPLDKGHYIVFHFISVLLYAVATFLYGKYTGEADQVRFNPVVAEPKIGLHTCQGTTLTGIEGNGQGVIA
jgi:hypothetical protein